MFTIFKPIACCAQVKYYACLLFFSAACIIFGSPITYADNAANWQKIEEADAKLHSVRLEWSYARIIGPQPPMPEEVYKNSADQLREKGMSEKAIKRIVKSLRASDKEQEHGIKYNGEMECLRIDKEMRLNMTFSRISGNTRTPEKLIINYTDGNTGLLIDRTKVGSKSPIPQWGRVVTNPDPLKTMIAVPGSLYQLVLFAKPLTILFPPAETKMTDNGEDTLILETVENAGSDFPVTIRAVVSKTSWRPVKIERFPPHTTTPSKVFEASAFHDYGNGVWLPTRFTYKMPAIQDIISCTLQKAVIGETIPDEDIKIMYGPYIQDCRFDGCIQYKLVSGIIPDEEKVEEMKSGVNSEIPDATDGNIPMLAPPLFALFLVGLAGLAFWVETRISRKNGK